MQKENNKLVLSPSSETSLKKYLFWILIFAMLVLTFFVLKPFFIALVSAFILAYMVRPVHYYLSSKINPKVSAALCVVLIIAVIVLPSFIILSSLISQINSSITISDLSEEVFNSPILKNLEVNTLKDRLLSLTLSIISSTLTSLPAFILSLLIAILAIYYILINWEYIAGRLEAFIPFKNKKEIRKDISEITKNIVFGYVLIAILEFIVGFIGFYLAGVKLYILLPALIAILAFIPGLGPGVVWVPTTIYYAINQQFSVAIGVIVTGLVISVFIETLLFAKIVGKRSKIHPLIFLIGVFGGIPIFGVFGFIIGPMILFYTLRLIDGALEQ